MKMRPCLVNESVKHGNQGMHSTNLIWSGRVGMARLIAALGLLLLIPCICRAAIVAPIICGQTVANTTTNAGQVDQYTLTGTAGQVLRFAIWGPVNMGYGCHPERRSRERISSGWLRMRSFRRCAPQDDK